jgi:hypothetical protein
VCKVGWRRDISFLRWALAFGWKVEKGNNVSSKDDIMGYVNPTRGRIQTLVSFMLIAIPKEHTTFRSERKLMYIAWS